MGPDVLQAEHVNCTCDQSSSLSLDMWRDIATLRRKFRELPASKERMTILTRPRSNKVARALHATVKAKDGLQRACIKNCDLSCSLAHYKGPVV